MLYNPSALIQQGYKRTYNYINKHAVTVVLLVISALSILIFCYRVVSIDSYTLGFGAVRERNIVYSIQQWMENGSLYTDPQQPPFSVTQYSPLYYIICGSLSKLLALNPNTDIHQIYIVGRAISLLANLLTSIIILIVLRRTFTLPWKHSLIAAHFSFFLVYYMFPHTITSTDALKAFFVILAVYFLLKFLSHKALSDNILSSIFFLAAAFTKLDALSYIPLVLIFLLLAYGFRFFFLSILIYLLVFLIFGLMFIWPYEEHIFANVFGGVAQKVSLLKGYQVLQSFLAINIVLVILSLFVAFDWLLSENPPVKKFISVFCLMSFFIALATSIKMGSATSYYTDFQNISIIIIAGYSRYNQNLLKNAGILFVIATLVVIHSPAITFFNTVYQFKNYNQERAHVYINQVVVANYIYEELSLKKGDFILSFIRKGESPIKQDYFTNLMYKNIIAPNEDVYFLSPSSQFNHKLFEDYIKNGKIKFIVDAYGSYPKEFMDIRLTDFEYIKDIEGYSIYRNKNTEK